MVGDNRAELSYSRFDERIRILLLDYACSKSLTILTWAFLRSQDILTHNKTPSINVVYLAQLDDFPSWTLIRNGEHSSGELDLRCVENLEQGGIRTSDPCERWK